MRTQELDELLLGLIKPCLRPPRAIEDAAAGFAGAGVGIGYIFGKMIEVVARQPEAEARVTKYMWIGFALVEAIALYGLVIAFIIMGFRK